MHLLALNLNQRTVQVELMRLALTHPDEIGYKQIGRAHLFWIAVIVGTIWHTHLGACIIRKRLEDHEKIRARITLLYS